MKTNIYGILINGIVTEEVKGARNAEIRMDELRINRGGNRQLDGSIWDAQNKISSRKGGAACGVSYKFLREES